MNKIKKTFLVIICLASVLPETISAQDKLNLTLDDVVAIAREQSPMATMARHQFRRSYWEYRSFKAGFLPSLTMNATLPDFNRTMMSNINDDGSESFITRNAMNTSVDLNLSQNVGLTGGSIFVNSSLQRIDNFNNVAGEVTSYLSSPFTIGFNQPVNGYNSFKWEKKIEPAKYEEAKKDLIHTLEQVNSRAVTYFFDLILAQINLEIAEKNFANNDTLYHIAEGRYQLGTIAENELLQMELSWLNADAELKSSNIDLEVKKFQLNSFLGYGKDVDIELQVPKDLPKVLIDYSKALQEANTNNPEVMAMQRQLLEAEQNVAQARSQKGLDANLFALYGMSKDGTDLPGVYQDPEDLLRFRVGIEIPILDWGEGRGKYKMAQSAQEVTRTNVQQSRNDFEQKVFLQVMQFNQQSDQLTIATKADAIAQKRYEVTKQRFLIGKIDVLDLNVALEEKDVARRRYVQALRNYWNYFYDMRILTLYDWVEDAKIEQDFNEVLLK